MGYNWFRKVSNLFLFGDLDTSLKDGLFHEFKKFGKVTSVQIHGTSEERYGLVFFRQQEDQEKALTASKGKLFFGMQIEVTAWIGPGKSAGSAAQDGDTVLSEHRSVLVDKLPACLLFVV